MTIAPTVRVHAAIAELRSPVKLWYALRAIDLEGCGKVVTTIKEIADLTGMTEQTIQAYAYRGQKMKLFRAVIKQRGGSEVTFYLASLFNVCLEFGIEHWGATTEIYVSDLRHLRLHATQAAAQRLQRCSRHQAKQKNKFVESVQNLLDPSSSKVRGEKGPKRVGTIFNRTDRFIYASADFPSFGGSQASIGDKISRTARTVQRRLSHSNRRKKDLPVIDRIQVMRLGAELKDPRSFQELLKMGFRGIIGTQKGGAPIKVWKYCTNIYSEDIKLFSQRQLRKKFAKLLDRLSANSTDFRPARASKLEIQSSIRCPEWVGESL